MQLSSAAVYAIRGADKKCPSNEENDGLSHREETPIGHICWSTSIAALQVHSLQYQYRAVDLRDKFFAPTIHVSSPN
jgi:hypothetical protein